jgi:serine/threonine-protein kinase Chk1
MPHLTRFYTSIGPGILIDLIKESLESLGVKYKDAPAIEGQGAPIRLRLGGYDKRKIMFKGWLEVENYNHSEFSGAFCVMQRDVVRVVPRWFASVYSHIIGQCREIRSLGDSSGRL